MTAHLEALQAIADAHGGNRATGTSGFDASVDYVAERLAAAGHEVRRQAFSVSGVASVNLCVDVGGERDELVVIGAHLDSVRASPGINDNGTGVATVLAIAERLPDLPAPARTLRICFWGAEEGGPHGSLAYLDALAPDERERIRAYLNFDMLGSPNAVRFVYDEAGGPPGSQAITAAFGTHFEALGLPWAPIDVGGRSDHGPFGRAGIPVGGLFSGGREVVTEAQAATFGAVAGAPSDPCSDSACDGFANVDIATLEEMADAVGNVVVAVSISPP